MNTLFDDKSLGAFFKNILAKNTLYRTFLLTGPLEYIENTIAKQIAFILLCCNENPPCLKCNSCVKVANGMHPDFIQYLALEQKSISIEEIREIISESSLRPWEAKYKIFLLPKIDLMLEYAANALLKILEEPPDHCIFLLTAENESSVLGTIRSRCQTFSVGPKYHNIADRLAQEYHIEKESAATIISLSNGTWDDIIEIVKNRWQHRSMILDSLLQKNDPIELGEKMVDVCGGDEEIGRQNSKDWIVYIASFWHDVLLCFYSQEKNVDSLLTNKDYIKQIKSLSLGCNIPKVHKFLEFLLFQTKNMIALNVSLSLLWESIFLEMQTLWKEKIS
ncbi:MAG: hypothetical protein HUU50_02185 [Candidatus Brocadiae bacterium]|nr:hypothetical protein [Candidatus Brocadiia bacterium]